MKTQVFLTAAAFSLITCPAFAQSASEPRVESRSVSSELLDPSSLDQEIPEVTVTGIDTRYNGKTAELFYVSGREGSIAMAGRSLKMRSVMQIHQGNAANLMSSVRSQVGTDGSVTFPSVIVPRAGFGVANYAVLLIHGNSGPVYLKNTDGSCPNDMRMVEGDLECSRLPEASVRHEVKSFIAIEKLDENKDRSGKKAKISHGQMF